jgi:S1-C subfamily serine protease
MKPGSVAQHAGIQSGFVIESMDRQPVASVADFTRLVDGASVRQGFCYRLKAGDEAAL